MNPDACSTVTVCRCCGNKLKESETRSEQYPWLCDSCAILQMEVDEEADEV